MAADDRTYVIDPEATDPELVRCLTALGEDAVAEDVAEDAEVRPRATGRRKRRVAAERRAPAARPAATASPPARPALWLLAAYALGPFALILDAPNGRTRTRWAAALGAAALAAAAAWVRTLDPSVLGGGDRALLLQGGAITVGALVWLTVWDLGLNAAARRCGEGPLSRRGRRRPFVAALAGLAAPGLGLLLAGRRVRCATTVAVVGIGAAAAVMLRQTPAWWSWHRADSEPLVGDLQLEWSFLVLAALAATGAVAWLVSALEAGRLAAGPRLVRAVSGADRVPAALVIALMALAIWFRPLDAAHGLDRLTGALASAELRLAPLWTARAAARLAPADPVLALQVAECEAALGHVNRAAAVRDRLRRRWRRFVEVDRRLDHAFEVGTESPARPQATWSKAASFAPFTTPLAPTASPPTAP